MELASLRADVDVIFEMLETEPEHAPTNLAEDTVLEALFKAHAETQPEPRACGKRHQSNNPDEAGDEARARRSERRWNKLGGPREWMKRCDREGCKS